MTYDETRIEELKTIANDLSKPIEERRKAWREFNRLTNPHYQKNPKGTLPKRNS